MRGNRLLIILSLIVVKVGFAQNTPLQLKAKVVPVAQALKDLGGGGDMDPTMQQHDSLSKEVVVEYDTVHEWIRTIYMSGKVLPGLKKEKVLNLSDQDSLRFYVNKEGDGSDLRFKVKIGDAIIFNEQTLNKSGDHGPFYLPHKVGPGPITFVFDKSNVQTENFTISFEKHFSYMHMLSVERTSLQLVGIPGADTAATVLFEKTLSIPPREYGDIKVELINLQTIEADMDYWMYYIGYGEDVQPVLADFALQNPLTSGDAIQDYGLERVTHLPEFPGRETAYLFRDDPLPRSKTLPKAKASRNLNGPPVGRADGKHEDYFGVVERKQLPNFLYLLNYASFERQLVYVKIVGFKALAP